MSDSRSLGLTKLIWNVRHEIDGSLPTARTMTAVMEAVREAIEDPDLLLPEQRVPDLERYRQHVLHVEADGSFSVVALVWGPGQATPVHDHRAWCVVGVIEGEESEVRFRRGPDGTSLVPTCTAINRAGCVQGLLVPDEIHAVANRGEGVAVSLHVYGTDLSRFASSIRRRYECEV
jgi:predicted metal-dependent enzyme (double-stranded beta helix superfamily)